MNLKKKKKICCVMVCHFVEEKDRTYQGKPITA